MNTTLEDHIEADSNYQLLKTRRTRLGWQHRVSFDDLVREMVEADRIVMRDEQRRRERS